MIDKQNTQAIFHFLLSQLIVECSEHIKEGTPDTKIHEIGKELGFKIYPQICLKRGITQRPSTIVDALKNIKAKVFKHLFNYELSPQTNTYRIQQKKSIVYGIVDEIAIYLAWMPQGCQMTASSLVAGLIQGICINSDLKCTVTCRKLDTEKEEKCTVEYLIEMTMQQVQKWQKK